MSSFHQQLSQKQQQKLSPLQIQQIKLLELTGIEMEERVNRELEENPALEETQERQSEDEPNAASIEDSEQERTEIELGDYRSEEEIPDVKLQQAYTSSREWKEETPYSEDRSFREHLFSQFHLKKLTDRQFQVGDYLIGCIDNDGYIRQSISSISDDLAFQYGMEVSEGEIRETLKAVQELDPAGIGAVDLRDCLLLQIRRRQATEDRQTAIEVLEGCFDEFTKRQYGKILRILGIDEDRLKGAIGEITSLNPKPGNTFGNSMETKMSHVTPDFFVEDVNGELILSMNENIPDLRINNNYSRLLERYSHARNLPESERKEVLSFINSKIDSARWFIDAIEQRRMTLRTTMEAIIGLQRDFFFSGEESDLRPMILKDVADICGYNVATISRVGNSKYVQTNFGVYPLKFFFSKHAKNSENEDTSTREIKSCLRRIVEEEDKTAPFTDDILLLKLKEEGYCPARRTIAKYREQLGIPPARLRKELCDGKR
ncbi:MAG: RNA polymerase factor sigma-54 [Dysgonamonadaceae bacterium]|jgi:RNA polymerase sigma-54 factor|nr:RNA polymerase factor sigma-54 [Dysgonamonadaceae bacterium]